MLDWKRISQKINRNQTNDKLPNSSTRYQKVMQWYFLKYQKKKKDEAIILDLENISFKHDDIITIFLFNEEEKINPENVQVWLIKFHTIYGCLKNH